jgi:hypothetical protein
MKISIPITRFKKRQKLQKKKKFTTELALYQRNLYLKYEKNIRKIIKLKNIKKY